MNLCADCKHVKWKPVMGPANSEAWCHRPRPIEVDIVSGRKIVTVSFCPSERSDKKGCGKKGKYFEPIPEGWFTKLFSCRR